MSIRERCAGIAPLTARLEPWQVAISEHPEDLDAWLDAHGSPLNLLDPEPMARNAAALQAAAADAGVDLGIHFARKANKALAFVDQALRLGLGVDLAGERELEQVLGRGVPGAALVMTAAVKPRALLERCLQAGATVVVDNTDELELLATLARDRPQPAPVALRLAPDLGPGRPQTRFGMPATEAAALVADGRPGLRLDGVHFHLDGYAAADRVEAISQATELVDMLCAQGHAPSFIDMGGGFPMSYLDSAVEWDAFWIEHGAGLLGEREPLTYEAHGLGLVPHDGELLGRRAVYPFHQRPVQEDWLAGVLAGRAAAGLTVAEALTTRGLQLRCEPGRALLDGCGMTAARITHRKQRRDETWLIGVEMNRTQCRSTSEDFMVDPLLLRPASAGPPTDAIDGYLVGAYCIERELLTWRRLRFPAGVAVGDIVVFPNTAGYLMHILESSSHQIPLARNVVVRAGEPPELDPIDRAGQS